MRECEVCIDIDELAENLASFFRKIYEIEGGIPPSVSASLRTSSPIDFCNFLIIDSREVRFHFRGTINLELARREVFFGLERCGASLNPPFYAEGVSVNSNGGFDLYIKTMHS